MGLCVPSSIGVIPVPVCLPTTGLLCWVVDEMGVRRSVGLWDRDHDYFCGWQETRKLTLGKCTFVVDGCGGCGGGWLAVSTNADRGWLNPLLLGGWNELSARLKGQPKVVFAVSASINSKVFVGGAPCEERWYTYIVDGTNVWGDGKKVSTTWLMMMIAAIAIRYSNDYMCIRTTRRNERRVVEWVDRSRGRWRARCERKLKR